jgi:aspartate kinase
MALIVQKYGGTSVGNPERIRNCARRILETQRAGHQVVAVVSAMSDRKSTRLNSSHSYGVH